MGNDRSNKLPKSFKDLKSTHSDAVKLFQLLNYWAFHIYLSRELYKSIRIFTCLFLFFEWQVIGYLQTVYQSVADIDLYIGGVTEKQMPGAAVGPTFGYIIANQFQNLKVSDRFFYSDRSQPISFTASKNTNASYTKKYP